MKRHKRKIILIAGSVFHLLHDGIADGMAVFLPLWQISFGLSLTYVGLLVTCFEGVTGFFQIPAGFLGERFGERILLVVGTMVTAICFICLGFAEGLMSLVVFLCLGGMGASVQHPLAASMVSKAYNENGRRTALGTYNFSGDMGKFLFPAMTAAVLSQAGWRPVCAGLGIFGFVLALTLFFILRQAQIGENTLSQAEQKAVSSKPKGWGIINKSAFSTLSIIAIIDTGVRTGLITFGPFLFIQKGIQVESVGFTLSLLLVGGAAGKFLCGALAERIGVIATVVITETLTGVGILVLAVLPFPQLYFFLPLLGAVLNGTSSVLYGTVGDLVNPHRIARAFGIFYTFTIAAGAASPPIMGSMSDLMGVENSIRLIGWVALAIVPMAFVLARQAVELKRKS